MGGSPDSGNRSSSPRTFLLILLLAVGLRSYHLAYPFWDYSASRQTLNLMVVREFARHGFHLLQPRVTWLASTNPEKPSYFLGEFPLVHSLVAAALRVFAWGDWCSRAVIIAFSLAGLYWMYALTKLLMGEAVANYAALAWAVLPFSIFFGRAFLSDLPALALTVGTLFYFARWLETRGWQYLSASGLCGALALLAMPAVVSFCFVLAYLAFVKLRWRVLQEWRLYMLALVLFLPALMWSHHIENLQVEGGQPLKGTAALLSSWAFLPKPSTWADALGWLLHVGLGPVGLSVAGLGLFWPGRRAHDYVFHVWLLGSACLLLFMPGGWRGWNTYSLLPLVFPAAGLIGRGLGGFSHFGTSHFHGPILTVLFVLSSVLTAVPLYHPNERNYRLGSLLGNLTRPDDLLATANEGSPDLLYFADRRGWDVLTYDPKEIDRIVGSGARVFATGVPATAFESPDVRNYLDSHFTRLDGDNQGWTIWGLDEPPQPYHELRAGEILNPYPVNFDQKIEMLGTGVRQVLRWPTTFEIVYYWQCLKKLDVDLVAFVHMTNPDGRRVFQQDHQPLNGHIPTSRWNIGDIIKERYVITFPNDTPAGTYQVRVGWWDPAKGPRLLVVSPGPSGGQDWATVAEVEVHRAPRYGWFNLWY